MSEGGAMGWGIGSDKRQEALEMLFEGETQTAIAVHFGIGRASVNEFANHPETKRSLARMGRAFEQEIARKGAHAVRGAVERTIDIAEDSANDASVRLAANKVLMATFGFAPGRKVELGGHVANVKIDLSKLPRELLDAWADGEGDDLDIPAELLDEAMAAQGAQ